MVKAKDGSPKTKYSQAQNEIKSSEKGIFIWSLKWKSAVKRMK